MPTTTTNKKLRGNAETAMLNIDRVADERRASVANRFPVGTRVQIMSTLTGGVPLREGVVVDGWHNPTAGCYVVRVELPDGSTTKVDAGKVRARKGGAG